MFSVIRRCLLTHTTVKCIPRSAGGPSPVYMQVATMKNIEPFNTFDDVRIPPKPKLKFLNKVPKKTRYRKVFKGLHDIRGPSEVANKLMYNQYGLLATTPGYMRHGHFEMIRLTINRFIGDSDHMFARWRVNAPFKPVTKKGQGQRMGGGKGSVHHYVTPVKAGRLVMEMGGKMEFEEVHSILYQISKKLPFRCKVVSKEIMERDANLYQFRKAENINPWTFERIAKENYLGISKYLGPCDYKWFGEHR
ncbi:39S ribosomal protein L16, mitochondrial-like [Lytechinus variegatus]|uniref:39S ribosomal protein L16, mitochondrial-like n=1 Tax=Lytechinus variegatus TaxID=7654 RepID=UPI001BB194EB|nr:39S ribosomal protein L16, mitochondrial-like [Lytechinus variegatus]